MCVFSLKEDPAFRGIRTHTAARGGAIKSTLMSVKESNEA